MRSAFALRIFSGKNIYNFAILENLRIFQNCLFTGGVGTNSLSQSLTALTAPSGREPLARPDAFHFSLKLHRHAKGPISEGAGIEQSEMTGGVSSNAKRLLHVLVQQPFYRFYSSPFFSISSSGISSVLTMVSICSSFAHSAGVKRCRARSTTVCR